MSDDPIRIKVVQDDKTFSVNVGGFMVVEGFPTFQDASVWVHAFVREQVLIAIRRDRENKADEVRRQALGAVILASKKSDPS